MRRWASMRTPLSPEELQKYIAEIQPLKTGFDFVQDHTIITDEHANILYANKAAEQQTGFSIEEMIGKNPADLWGGKMPKEFYERMWHQIKIEKKPFVGEVQNIRKDGSSYWQALHISPILNDNGEVKFFIGIEPNISDEKKREAFQQEFISIIGHQLKNPVSAVKWLLDWVVSRGKIEEKDRKKIEQAYLENQSVGNLISDLLTVAHIGKPEMKITRFDIVAEIERMVASMQAMFPFIRFEFKKEVEMYMISANKTLALQIFKNIITNAAEYSHEKGAKVEMKIYQEKNNFVFSCKDSGIGIPPEDQPHIFDRFFRASNANTIKKAGTGLGLFIARMICDSLGWHISFTSALGGGTTFSVIIPANTAIS